jgi:hypothetical protein
MRDDTARRELEVFLAGGPDSRSQAAEPRRATGTSSLSGVAYSSGTNVDVPTRSDSDE